MEETPIRNHCWTTCRGLSKCSTFSFHLKSRTCFLFESCPELVSNNQFISGQKSYDYGKSRSKENSLKNILSIIVHFSEKRGLCLMKCSCETLQNLPYFGIQEPVLFFCRHRPGHSFMEKK